MRNILILCALLGCCSFAFADEPVLTEQESQFLQILNDARTAKGLQPLSIDADLLAGAKRWSLRINGRSFGHDPNLRGCSENICIAGSATSAFSMWRSSSRHWSNLMSPNISACGIAKSGNSWVFRGGRSVVKETVKVKTVTKESAPRTCTGPYCTPKACPPAKACTSARCQ